MKAKVNLTLTVVFLLVTGLTLSAQQAQQKQKEAKVAVYYFHFTTRCETCRAVESEARQDVKELFGADVSFAAYNLDEPAGEAMGKKVGIESQSLVAVKGEKKVDLTTDGFLYANTDPEKFKKIIDEKIRPLL